MSDNKINKNIRYYLPNDPYYYEVDNLPIKDLLDNDDRLQIQIDQLKAQFDVVQGRSTFGELKPFLEGGNPGRVFVNPGNFMARVDSGSSRYTGLQETDDTSYGSNPTPSDGTASVDTIDIEANAQDIGGGTARTSLVRLHKNSDGTIPNIAISEGTVGDYPNDANSVPPAYRLDLIYVKGTKAEDQDGGEQTGATLGVVRGAYFIKGPSGGAGRSGDLLYREDKTMIQNVNDVPVELIEVKKNPSDGRPLYTTVPTPDLANTSNSTVTPISMGDGTSIDKAALAQYLESNENSFMGCPVAYVLVPFNYIAGTDIPEANLIDIRPFFRTSELTLPERQAIATADEPSIINPFMTAKSSRKYMTNEVNRAASRGNIQQQIYEVESSIPTFSATQDFAVFGKVMNQVFPQDSQAQGAQINPQLTLAAPLTAGTWMIFITQHSGVAHNYRNMEVALVNAANTVVYGKLYYHGNVFNSDDDSYFTSVFKASIPPTASGIDTNCRVRVTMKNKNNQTLTGSWGGMTLYDGFAIFLQ